jgi:hypothetical protein
MQSLYDSRARGRLPDEEQEDVERLIPIVERMVYRSESRIERIQRLPQFAGTAGVISYLRIAATCQARAPSGFQVRSMTADSMDSILHPAENAA